jgi:hypothetical protein
MGVTVLVQVPPVLCASCVYADSVLGHDCHKIGFLVGFHETWPGFFLSEFSTFYSQKHQVPTDFLLRFKCEVACCGIALPHL